MSARFSVAQAPAGLLCNAAADGALRDWLGRLDDLVVAACRRWELEVVEALPAQYSVVLSVVRADGAVAILKLIPPDDFAALEIPALRAYDGTCSPLLLAHDQDLDAVLIERVTPARPLLYQRYDDNATAVLAEVMSRLWSVPTTRLRPGNRLSDWAVQRPDIMRSRALRHQDMVSQWLLDQAAETLRDWDDSPDDVILHGDLHHGNVLESDRCGWVAIDPSSRVGRREAEVAAVLRNPWGALHDVRLLRARHDRRLAILGEVLDLDLDRCRRWAFANTLDLAIWSAVSSRSDDAEYLFAVARSLQR